MKKSVLPILLLLMSCCCFSQRNILEFGKIDPADLALTACPFEPSAPAMKLFDVQTVEFIPDNRTSELKIERRVRLKLFRKEGYQYASIRLPYISKYNLSSVWDLKGMVYNTDEQGQVTATELLKKDFFKTRFDDGLGTVSFTFPNLKPGSVIEYSYTRIERFSARLEPWIIQGDLPVGYAAYILITPPVSTLREKTYGFDSLQHVVQTTADDRVKRIYYKEKIASFQQEPFAGSVTDNLMRVKFLFYPKGYVGADVLTAPQRIWKQIGLELLGSPFFGGQITKVIPGTDSLIDAANRQPSVARKIELLFEAVKNRFPNPTEQTTGVSNLDEVWKTQNGTTADINLTLLNLLQKAGVSSYPLLVSTRSHGKISMDFPSIGQFNGLDVLAADSERVYILDAGIKGQSFLNPPFNILNRIALMMDANGVKWVRIDDERPLLRQEVAVKISISEDGCIDGTASLRYFDLAKTVLLSDEEEAEPALLNETIPDLNIRFQSVRGNANRTAPYEKELHFTYALKNKGDYAFLSPLFLFSQVKNPLIKTQRLSDIDMGCNQQQDFSLTIQLPSSYTIEALPQHIVLRTPDSSMLYQRVCTKDSSQIYFSQRFETRRSVFEKEEYPVLYEFFKKDYGLMQEEIVLKKTN